jgi:hypothetical protein
LPENVARTLLSAAPRLLRNNLTVSCCIGTEKDAS